LVVVQELFKDRCFGLDIIEFVVGLRLVGAGIPLEAGLMLFSPHGQPFMPMKYALLLICAVKNSRKRRAAFRVGANSGRPEVL
jgi:hypothetical protein